MCPDHEKHPPIVQLSLDGIQESKSSSNSLEVYSLKFNHCRNIYPFRIIRPCNRYKFDEQFQLQEVLRDINSNNVIIDCVVMDNPKRSMALCLKCSSAKFPCQYCQNSAITHSDINKKTRNAIEKKYKLKMNHISKEISKLKNEEEDNDSENDNISRLMDSLADLKKQKENEINKAARKQLTWPASTMAENPRTIENITEIVNAIEEDPEILKTNPDFCKGLKGKSLLLDQPSFHIIKDTPCEYMHSTCLGVVRRLTELTFHVGENRDRVTNRKRSDPKKFNDLILLIQVPCEYGRRCRILDFGVWKAAEFRNLILFIFPIVLECIEHDFKDEKRIWLHLAFMIRACVLSNEEFRIVNVEDVKSACKKFYILYEKVFGEINCTYSIHVVGGHLLSIKQNRPLTFKSAFKFENFFSEMRHLFQAGTISPLKQILKNCFVKRLLEYHFCEKKNNFQARKKR